MRVEHLAGNKLRGLFLEPPLPTDFRGGARHPCYAQRVLNLHRCVVGVVAVLLMGTVAGCGGGDSSSDVHPP